MPQVTTQLLVETQAGKKIRKLTKHSNAAVSQAAAAAVAAWKEAVKQEVGAGGPTGQSTMCSCPHLAGTFSIQLPESFACVAAACGLMSSFLTRCPVWQAHSHVQRDCCAASHQSTGNLPASSSRTPHRRLRCQRATQHTGRLSPTRLQRRAMCSSNRQQSGRSWRGWASPMALAAPGSLGFHRLRVGPTAERMQLPCSRQHPAATLPQPKAP